jgi:hypothetical protein
MALGSKESCTALNARFIAEDVIEKCGDRGSVRVWYEIVGQYM